MGRQPNNGAGAGQTRRDGGAVPEVQRSLRLRLDRRCRPGIPGVAPQGLDLHLEPTPDILAELGRRRGSAQRPVLVGFAAEINDLVPSARRKLEAKNLDHIVANQVGQVGTGFGAETNQVTLISRNGDTDSWPVMSKAQVAARLLDHLAGAHFSTVEETEK